MGSTKVYLPASAGEEINIYDGDTTRTYKIRDGAVMVDDAHVSSILTSVPGARLKSEAPMLDKSALGTPAKEK